MDKEFFVVLLDNGVQGRLVETICQVLRGNSPDPDLMALWERPRTRGSRVILGDGTSIKASGLNPSLIIRHPQDHRDLDLVRRTIRKKVQSERRAVLRPKFYSFVGNTLLIPEEHADSLNHVRMILGEMGKRVLASAKGDLVTSR